MIQCCSVVKGFNFNLIARKCLKPLFELSVTVSKQFFFPPDPQWYKFAFAGGSLIVNYSKQLRIID